MKAGRAVGLCLKKAVSYFSPNIPSAPTRMHKVKFPIRSNLYGSEQRPRITGGKCEFPVFDGNRHLLMFWAKFIGAFGQHPRAAIGAVEWIISGKGSARYGKTDCE